mmetsp:Transcript_1855/g.8262  ORF Transcript_1855/g.8262 Transcript_1855/m.8262 type:complete len:213 (+) Transcript_1855:247-885(+)
MRARTSWACSTASAPRCARPASGAASPPRRYASESVASRWAPRSRRPCETSCMAPASRPSRTRWIWPPSTRLTPAARSSSARPACAPARSARPRRTRATRSRRASWRSSRACTTSRRRSWRSTPPWTRARRKERPSKPRTPPRTRRTGRPPRPPAGSNWTTAPAASRPSGRRCARPARLLTTWTPTIRTSWKRRARTCSCPSPSWRSGRPAS